MAVAAVLAIASVAWGCGSSDDSTGGDTEITKAEFVRQADAICRHGLKARDASLYAVLAKATKSNPGKPLTAAQKETALLTGSLPPIVAMTEELDELGAPAGDEKKVAAIVQGFEAAVQSMEEDPAAALERTADPFGVVSRLALRYGLTSCA